MAHATPEKPLYLFAHIDVRDPAKMRRYAIEAPPMVERFGGRVIAISVGSLKVIEGAWRPEVLALHRWPSLEAFQTFYDSDEYQPLKDLRRAASDTNLVVFDGLAP